MRSHGHARIPRRHGACHPQPSRQRDTLFVIAPRDCFGTCDESSDDHDQPTSRFTGDHDHILCIRHSHGRADTGTRTGTRTNTAAIAGPVPLATHYAFSATDVLARRLGNSSYMAAEPNSRMTPLAKMTGL